MNRRENSDFEELEELLWRAEEVLKEPAEEPADEDYSDYGYPDNSSDDPALYRNYANGYNEEPAYHTAPAQQHYEQRYDRPAASYPPYDEFDEDDFTEPPPIPRKKPTPPKKRRRGCGCGCFTWLVIFVAAIIAAAFLFIRPPQSDDSIGSRKRDSASILICGTDKDGTRTDTMMLLYLSGSDNQVSLLSLPRDSYTITSSGKAAKLNSAYGRGGTGEEGMENLLDYVQDIIGYRPDGYVLVDFTLVPQIVDIMGGVDVEVPMDMKVDGISLEAGYQHLNGKQALTLLRFRKGYAMADLTRIEVQRSVLKACMEQWLSIEHITDAMEAVSLIENGSISSLNMGNYIWVAKTMLTSMSSFRNDTLPGYADYIGSASYYILKRSDIAELINEAYNPYQVTIYPEDLNIAG